MYRGVGADFEKPKKYFRLIMKKNYLENFKPLYTNKKVVYKMPYRRARAWPSSCIGQVRPLGRVRRASNRVGPFGG